MRGLFGVFYYDRTPVHTRTLRRGLRAMAERTRGPIRAWQGDGVGLAVRSRDASSVSSAPVVDLERGLTVVADTRLDNRADLLRTFGLRNAPPARQSDAALILEAYSRWGLDAPTHLIGAFAYALWDAGARRLVLARDPIGVRPLFVHLGTNGVVFASTVPAVLSASFVPDDLNETRIAQYLARSPGDAASTFYRSVERVRPGHWICAPADGTVRRTRYWSIHDIPAHTETSDEDAIERFREIFTEAVRCRLDDCTGVMLSGGLDSSSVAAVARQASGASLPTFSAVFPDVPEEHRAMIDETEYVDVMAELPGMDAHRVSMSDVSPAGDLDRIVATLGRPPSILNSYLYRSIHAAAQREGVHVLLDGAEGDDTVSHGYGWLCELAAHDRWDRFATEAFAVAERCKTPKAAAATFWRFGAPYVEEAANDSWMRGLSRAREAARAMNLSAARVLWRSAIRPSLPGLVDRAWGRLRGDGDASSLDLVHPDLARHVAATSEPDGDDAMPTTDQEVHSETFSGDDDMIALILEEVDHLSALSGVEQRHPFYDVRLVEYCVALPGHLKRSNGWDRYVLRRAMRGILPNAIRWRPDKANLGPSFYRNLHLHDAERLHALPSSSALTPFVDTATLRRAVEQRNAALAWHALALDAWLRQSSTPPDSEYASHDAERPSAAQSALPVH